MIIQNGVKIEQRRVAKREISSSVLRTQEKVIVTSESENKRKKCILEAESMECLLQFWEPKARNLTSDSKETMSSGILRSQRLSLLSGDIPSESEECDLGFGKPKRLNMNQNSKNPLPLSFHHYYLTHCVIHSLTHSFNRTLTFCSYINVL